MKIAIVDCRIPKDAEGALSCYADKIVKLPPCPRLQSPVSAHPDMLMFVTDKVIITEAKYFEENKALLEELSALCGREIVLDPADLAPKYPFDVKFNCFETSVGLFGLTSAISKKITESVTVPSFNVRQGYAKCSSCVVSHDAVITEDSSIEKALAESGVDVLRVCAEHVALDGYNCGFIGGASGSDEKNVYFCGDVSKHPDFERISDFCRRHEKNCISLGNGTLYDVGTILFLEKL